MPVSKNITLIQFAIITEWIAAKGMNKFESTRTMLQVCSIVVIFKFTWANLVTSILFRRKSIGLWVTTHFHCLHNNNNNKISN